jgi:hypothetical protein
LAVAFSDALTTAGGDPLVFDQVRCICDHLVEVMEKALSLAALCIHVMFFPELSRSLVPMSSRRICGRSPTPGVGPKGKIAFAFSRLDHLTDDLADPGKNQADNTGLKAGCGRAGFRREKAERGFRQYHCRTRFQIFSAAPGSTRVSIRPDTIRV